MSGIAFRSGFLVLGVAAALALTACSSGKAPHRAPVEDRGASIRPASSAAAPEVKPLPGAENAGKPGYYTVRRGDTVMRIGLETGQAWRDIVRWNGIDNPNLIEVGQVLRVVPPVGPVIAAPVAPATADASGGVVTRPVTSSSVVAGSVTQAPVPAAVAPASAPVAAPAAASGEEEIAFIWPTSGALLAGFDEAKNKGLDLAGKAGDPVLAAADGRVVYAGAGLRGYGNLVILKHNNTYLTAYAHNQALLVKEDQSVRKGQKIAEVGSSDADRVKLHFEIRRQGKPVDPARLLPAR
jgi:lipoprotein NlpD